MPFPYSYTSYTAVNQTEFIYTGISLLPNVPVKDQLKVYLDGQLQVYGVNSPSPTGAYYLDLSTGKVIFHTAVSGIVKIARESDIENKEVTFTNSSVLTAQDLNKNTDQLLFLAQELYDKTQDISLTATGNIPPNSITSSQLISDSGLEAVTTSVIRDSAITTAKIADDAVTTAKIADDAVTTAKILNLNVTTGKIADSAVTSGKIANGAVTAAKMDSGFFEYKEWTPQLKYMASDGTIRSTSFTTALTYGYAIKLGRVVSGSFRVGWTAYSLGDGNLTTDGLFVQSLPYPITTSTINGVQAHGGAVVVHQSGWGTQATAVMRALTYSSGAYAQRLVFYNGSSTFVPLGSATAGGSNVIFNFLYLTD